MKYILTSIILFLVFSLNAQISITWLAANSLKTQGLLVAGQSYILTDLEKIELVATGPTSFSDIPLKRTTKGISYDEERFNFDTKILTGIDNIVCIARCNGGVWSLINDANHKSYRASYCSNNLMIWYSKQNHYDKVIGGNTSLDESYAASNLMVTCGGSISFNYAAIWFYKTVIVNGVIQKVQMTLQEASVPGSNVFFIGKMSKDIQMTTTAQKNGEKPKNILKIDNCPYYERL